MEYLLVFMFVVEAVLGLDSNGNWHDDEKTVEIFRDDFSGSALDLRKWNPSNLQSEVNDELEYYTPNAVSLDSGALKITANRTMNGSSYNYTSGRIDSQNKFSFKYGEVEWRAKLAAGKGLWTSLWILHKSCEPAVGCPYWPPSVSMDVRGDQPYTPAFSVYFKTSEGHTSTVNRRYNSTTDLTKDYSVFRLKWSRTKVEWFVNGASAFSLDNETASPASDMQIVILTAVGGFFPGNPDENTTFPSSLLVDYVSVRQPESLVRSGAAAVASSVTAVAAAFLLNAMRRFPYALCYR